MPFPGYIEHLIFCLIYNTSFQANALNKTLQPAKTSVPAETPSPEMLSGLSAPPIRKGDSSIGNCSHVEPVFLGCRADLQFTRKLHLPKGCERPSRSAVIALRPWPLLPSWAALFMPSCWSELGEVHSDQLIPTDNKRGGSLGGNRGGGGGDGAEDGSTGALEQPGSRRQSASPTPPCLGQAAPGSP